MPDDERRTLEAFAQVPALVAVVRGPDHVFELANERFRRACGLDDPIGRPARDMKVEAFGVNPVEALDLVRHTGEPWTGSEIFSRLDRGDGTVEEGWYTVDVRPIRDARGEVDGALIHAFDVSELVRSRAAVGERDAPMRRLYDSDMLGMAYWDQSGAITAANDEFLRIIGYSREDLEQGRIDWRAMTPREYIEQEHFALAEIAERGVCTPFEKEYVRKDGSRVPILIGGGTFQLGSSGGVTFALDLTDRTREETARRRAVELLRTVLAHAPIVLFALDDKGVVTLAEGRALAMSAKSGSDLVGTSALHRHGDKPIVGEHMRRAIAGEEFTAEHDLDGAVLETHYHPLRDVRGRLAGTVGVSIDVTERKRLEAEREASQAQMLQTQKLESLGVLAGGLAHDFNNLLTVIMGNASSALAATKDPKLTEPLADIVAVARRASDLTRQMLAYAGKARVEMRPVDLGVHVREIASLIESSLSKKVQLVLDVPNDLVVDADVAQVQQLVMNLVINGAEAIGDAPGVVTVRVGRREVDERHARALSSPVALQPGRCVVLEVSDTGVGMDAATRARIFDPFFTTKFTGRGLGLAAVLGIVRGHRGAIRIESALGRGTKFEVFFPASERAAISSTSSRRTQARGHGTILFVDDERLLRKMARLALVDAGFEVVEASNGVEAIEVFRARAEEIVVVVLDMTMPVLGGEETLAALRALRADARVVLSSGYDEAETTRRIAAPAPAGFLQKPYTASELVARVLEAMAVDRKTA